MDGNIFMLPFKSCREVILTSTELHLDPQHLPIERLAVGAVPCFILAVASSNAELILLLLNSHLPLCHHVPLAAGALHKHCKLPRRGVAVCEVADQSRIEREQLHVVEDYPGKSFTLQDNTSPNYINSNVISTTKTKSDFYIQQKNIY